MGKHAISAKVEQWESELPSHFKELKEEQNI